MPRIIEVQLHQTMRFSPNGDKRGFNIRKITGAVVVNIDGRRFYVGDRLDEQTAQALTDHRGYKVSVMATKDE